jgi:hypothetical protein
MGEDDLMAGKEVAVETSKGTRYCTITSYSDGHYIKRYKDGANIGKAGSVEDAISLIRADVGERVDKVSIKDS